MNKKTKTGMILFLVWIIFMGAMIQWLTGQNIQNIYKISILYWFYALIIYIISIILVILATIIASRKVFQKIPLRTIIGSIFFSLFIDNVTPTFAPMGTAAMAYYVKKKANTTYSKGFSLSTLTWSALILGNFTFGITAILLGYATINVPKSYVLPVAIAIISFFAVLAILLTTLKNKQLMLKIFKKLRKWYTKIMEKIKKTELTIEQKAKKAITGKEDIKQEEFKKFYKPIDIFFKNKKTVFITSVLTLISAYLNTFAFWVLLLGIGINTNIFKVIFIMAVAWILGVVFITPSGMGIYELSSTGLFMALGIPIGPAVIALTAYRLLFIWVTNGIGALFSINIHVPDVLPTPNQK